MERERRRGTKKSRATAIRCASRRVPLLAEEKAKLGKGEGRRLSDRERRGYIRGREMGANKNGGERASVADGSAHL